RVSEVVGLMTAPGTICQSGSQSGERLNAERGVRSAECAEVGSVRMRAASRVKTPTEIESRYGITLGARLVVHGASGCMARSSFQHCGQWSHIACLNGYIVQGKCSLIVPGAFSDVAFIIARTSGRWTGRRTGGGDGRKVDDKGGALGRWCSAGFGVSATISR